MIDTEKAAKQIFSLLTEEDLIQLKEGKLLEEVVQNRLYVQEKLLFEIIEQKTERSKKVLNDFCESVYTELNNK